MLGPQLGIKKKPKIKSREVAVQTTSGYICRLLFLCQSKFSNAQKFCYKHKKGDSRLHEEGSFR